MFRRRSATRFLMLSVVVVLLSATAWIGWRNLRFSSYLSHVRELLAEDNAEAAAALLEKATELYPANAEIRYQWAVALRRAGRLADAEKVLRQSDRLGYAASKIELQRCMLTAQSGAVDEAEPRLREIIQSGASDENAKQIYEALAKGFMAAQRLRAAWDCLEHWIAWQPQSLAARMLRGQICERNGEALLATKEYEAVLEQEPLRLDARLRLGKSLLYISNVQDAQRAFEACLRLDPQMAEATIGLAECFLRTGELEQALDAVNTALELPLSEEQAARAWRIKGRSLLAQRRNQEAAKALKTAVELSPSDAKTHRDLARAYALLGETELSQRQRGISSSLSKQNARLRKIVFQLSDEPRNAELRCELGALLLDQGRISEAEQWFRNALLIDPGNAHARHELQLLEDAAGNEG